MAQTARNHVNNACYQSLYQELSDSAKKMIDDLLVLDEKTRTTGWNELKREPKKAKSRAMKAYLQHLQWIQSLVEQVPSLGNISTSRRRQYLLEARALHANKMRDLKPIKRYALTIIYIHSQQQRALDNVAILFIKTMQNLQNAAQTKMEEYHLKQVKRTEKLITKFKEVLMAYQTHDKKSERLDAIQSVINDQPAEWLSECEAYLSYAGDNYAPFMLSVFRNYRSRLLACLECLQLKSTTRDQSIVRAVNFVLQHRDSRREWLDITGKGGKNVINLGWLTHFWRELITGEKSSKKKIIKIHRRYFELCVFTQVMRELKSGDLYVCQSDKFGDYREQLISWETYHQESAHYCDLMGLDSSPKAFVKTLKQEFLTLANKVDNHYPDNEYLELTDKGPVIKKHDTPERPAEVEKLDALITKKMQEIDILDLLVETERWLNLHKYFGPISGFQGKIDDVRKRFIATLFCYGCNLGPSQTARSVQGFSRKQIAWLNLKHVTEHQLEKVIEIVVNAYNKFRLPKYWGSGKQVAADGTKWNVYEQNLLSEYHIRYGGYGGIGYYHVSDQYIALFSHFIPCGVYEAIYILDGLIKNKSDIQPDIVHGDTQAQNAPVFGLSHLLGIKLMPRIRGMKNLIFFRPDKAKRYKHINALFKEQIDWELIETHYPDMLRIAMSIKAGRITPSTILRRLGTKSRKNRLYFAFRELGRVIRTMFLLNYIHDLELRKMIQSATNKSEEFNQFTKWLFFGNDYTDPHVLDH